MAPWSWRSYQPRPAAAQLVDPRIGLSDLQAEQAREVGEDRVEHRRRERDRLSDDARQRFQVQGEAEDIDVEFHPVRKRFRRARDQPRARHRLHPPLVDLRSEEHTSELQSLMRNSYAVFRLKKKTTT